MPETLFSPEELSELPLRLDQAMQAHLAWNQRLLRCALLGETPGDDTLQPNAFQLCRFGRWFDELHDRLLKLEPECVHTLDTAHRHMHLAVRELCLAAIAGNHAEAHWFEAFESNQSTMVRELAFLKERFVRFGAQSDPLTGLPLRHGLADLFSLRQADAERSNGALFIVLIDADHFKKINDVFGHPVGDAALVHLADLLKSTLRSNDHLLRYGGEEFMMLLYGASETAAEHVAQRLLQLIRSKPMLLPDGDRLPMTISLGMCRVLSDDSLESAIRRADVALYRAKRNGRDRYECAPY
jgi:diguanylate cyclase (GGDEF)-like protein